MNGFNLACFQGELKIGEDGKVSHCTVTPEAIAHGTAAVSRFGGQTHRPHSVAEHEVRLAWLLEDNGYGPAVSAAALIHDGPEAFGVGDINTFIKRRYGLDGLREFDRHMTEVFWDTLCRPKFDVPWSSVEEVVHTFDKWLGHWEARHHGFVIPEHIAFDPLKYNSPAALQVAFWSHHDAKRFWLDAWDSLGLPR